MTAEGARTPQNATPPGLPQHNAVGPDPAVPNESASTPWLAGIWQTIKEHKVVQWTLAYAAFGYTALHGMQMAREAFEWPLVVTRSTLLVVLLGTPVVATLAWYHGHRARYRISGSELSLLTVLLVIAGTLLWRFSGIAHEERVSGAAQLTTPPELASSREFVPPPRSVAVLPFVNLSADKDQDYFSDGLSEELINALSLISELQVAARTSSFSFKGQALDIESAARKLHVGAVLEGSVRRSGDTVRVTAQLINATNGFHIWSQTYDRDLKDVLAVQSDIAIAVAQELQAKLLGIESAKIQAGGTHNPQAYDTYLRATDVYWTAMFAESTADGEERLRTALAGYDRAIALDPNFAAAHMGRAFSLDEMGEIAISPGTRASVLAQAREAAERAIALGPDIGEAHLALAMVCVRALQFDCATSEYQRALALAPGDARVLANFAMFASLLGHREAAQAAALHALKLDPQNLNTHRILGTVLARARRFEEAIDANREAKGLNPGAIYADISIARSYMALGRHDMARQTCESSSRVMDADDTHWCLAVTYRALGRSADAQAELQQLRELDGDTRPVSYAELYAQWGDKRSALDWLATAEKVRDPQLRLVKVLWTFDPIRNEPEFLALERRLNFPP